MANNITFLEIAKKDVMKAFEWYDIQQRGLGKKLLNEIENSLKWIDNNPLASPLKYKMLRMKLLDHFPYALFYKIESSGHIRIYACLHLRRNVTEILRNR